jgi:hypothetical protein
VQITISRDSLLVKPEAARAQLDAESAPAGARGRAEPGEGAGPTDEGALAPSRVLMEATSRSPHRLGGSTALSSWTKPGRRGTPASSLRR